MAKEGYSNHGDFLVVGRQTRKVTEYSLDDFEEILEKLVLQKLQFIVNPVARDCWDLKSADRKVAKFERH